ncbi:MAG TPA: hypothetical protein VL494_13770 [Steroidobacteraceae bacterium]|jgi:hypothetical protein|nr:hypothetical protein [Steroidobacteraceae bacterium]
MTGLHESTLALSVYNAVARDGAMDGEQLLAYLRSNWDPRLEPNEVVAGCDYLKARRMIVVADGVVAPARLESGAARTVLRHPARQTELVYGLGAGKPTAGTKLG